MVQQFPVPVKILGQGGQRLHPIPAVEIPDPVLEHLVLRMMYMPADYSVASLRPCEVGEVGLETGDVIDSFLDLMLQHLGEGILLLAHSLTRPVPSVVELQEGVVSHIAEFGQPPELRGYAVEGVSVDHDVALSEVFDQIFAREGNIEKPARDDVVQEVIVVAGDIDHLGLFLLHHLHNDAEESRFFDSPFVIDLLELPAVYYVAGEDQPLAGQTVEESGSLPHLGEGGAHMDIGDDYRLIPDPLHIPLSSAHPQEGIPGHCHP